jgi:hypothetical protein
MIIFHFDSLDITKIGQELLLVAVSFYFELQLGINQTGTVRRYAFTILSLK